MEPIGLKKALRLFVGLLAIVLAFQLLSSLIPHEQLRTFVNNNNVTGPIFIVLLITLAEVFAPFPGGPAILASLAIFGWENSLVYSFAGLLTASIINFWLSRVFGRRFVQKFLGDKNIKKIDEFTEKEGKTALIISRTVGYPFSDFVSYAAGLTQISFRTYFLISTPCLAITHGAYFFLFRHLNFNEVQDFIFWFGLTAVSTVFFSIIFTKINRIKQH
jgi:uncharacterized membrane protein YdjX (TVP38/TMEM64 family)